jgi:hypothetical protein
MMCELSDGSMWRQMIRHPIWLRARAALPPDWPVYSKYFVMLIVSLSAGPRLGRVVGVAFLANEER